MESAADQDGGAVRVGLDAQSPAHEQIARRAFEIYDRSGRVNGRCRQNWYQAECELRKEAAAAWPREPGHTPPDAYDERLLEVSTFTLALAAGAADRLTDRGRSESRQAAQA